MKSMLDKSEKEMVIIMPYKPYNQGQENAFKEPQKPLLGTASQSALQIGSQKTKASPVLKDKTGSQHDSFAEFMRPKPRKNESFDCSQGPYLQKPQGTLTF